MAPSPDSKRNQPHGALVPATEEDRRELAAALAETGEVVLSREELDRWADTGDCPALDLSPEELQRRSDTTKCPASPR